ncbi:ABC transporter ATP-binding protein [Thiomonas delicata]|uniref:Spermidine/putrescine import ATP-binding protein PotA n=1 Tax=Thiomonas delicata TaxID=364030 RepID=A0A238D5L2_THIDL|nr:ABC transporter ATP-binding protein [Thiomonas delicata]SBP88521.1 Spermidine/putrescine import ATP-binding protein PotA [Thiomonas delicata]
MKQASVAITLRRCAKTFDHGQRALRPVDLSVAAGETVVLLGPSGCGKTTMLRLIAGLERPDPGGTVLFDGEDVTQQPIESRQVGMVFQSYALFPNMTVRGNIGYGLRIRRLPAAEITRRVDELLDLMRLREFAERAVNRLSGGQRQRVALARALAPRPRVLLLDEPLTALDAQLRETLRVEMNSLLRQLGITTVYVTHDQAEAMALGDRIVVMSAGRIEQAGTPREIYYSPASLAVARFIGTLNRLAGEVRDGRFHCAGCAAPIALPRRLPPGGAMWFRPEDARIVPHAEANLVGRVLQAVFLGDRTRLTVGEIGDAPVLVDVPGRADLAPSGSIGLAIAPDAWLCLPEDAA